MKPLLTWITAIAALVSFSVNAATLVPIQFLNPAGSSSGQAIVSTGASSAPAWGGIGLNGIASIAANTVLANATGSSAAPTAFSMPSCSATGNVLNWTSSTGFTCGTGYALLASPAFSGVPTAPNAAALSNTTQIANTAYVIGTLQSPPAIGAVTPAAGSFTALSATGTVSVPSGTTFNQPNNVGVTSGTAAATGSVGEQPTASTSTTPMTTATTVNATSKSLTAGQYLVWCAAQFLPAGSTTMGLLAVGVSTTSAVRPGSYASETLLELSFSTGLAQQIPSPVVPLLISTTTTVYCTAYASFGASTMTVSGTINALRVR